jgi:hypothetical protein
VSSVPLVRIFISSPGDVPEEREAARTVVDQELAKAPAFAGRIAFEVVAWDDPAARIPLLANETPQDTINRSRPRPATCDIVVVVLWSRMGTPLPDSIRKPSGGTYLSGTEWEYEDAANSRREPPPRVLVYQRLEEPTVRLLDQDRAEKEEQYKKVLQFVKAIKERRGGVNEYRKPIEFKEHLRMHLERLVWELCPPGSAPSRDSANDLGVLRPTLDLLEAKSKLIQKSFILLGVILVSAVGAALFALSRLHLGSLRPVALIAVLATSAAIALGYCWSCDNGCSTVRALLVMRRWEDAVEEKRKTMCLTGLPDVLFARSGGERGGKT